MTPDAGQRRNIERRLARGHAISHKKFRANAQGECRRSATDAMKYVARKDFCGFVQTTRLIERLAVLSAEFGPERKEEWMKLIQPNIRPLWLARAFASMCFELRAISFPG
jgi:hypothetical protein